MHPPFVFALWSFLLTPFSHFVQLMVFHGVILKRPFHIHPAPIIPAVFTPSVSHRLISLPCVLSPSLFAITPYPFFINLLYWDNNRIFHFLVMCEG